MRMILKVFTVTLLLMTGSFQAHSDKCMKIASDPNASKITTVMTPGIQMAFEKAKICANYITYPNARMQKFMIEGSIDGEFLRVKAYINAMKDHVAFVPTPIIEGNGVIISKGDFRPQSLKDVGDRIIGVLHAVRWHDALKKHIKTTRATVKYELLAKQLMANRIDGFLVDNVSLGRLYKSGALPQDKIIISPPVVNLSAYLLLHKRNAKFIPDLDKAVKSVKLEGGFALK